jgi:hypothetical protein
VKNTTATKSTTATRITKPRTSKKILEAKSESFSHIDTSKVITVDQRTIMIAEAAYYLAEKSGFNADSAIEHWLQAEKQIDEQILES